MSNNFNSGEHTYVVRLHDPSGKLVREYPFQLDPTLPADEMHLFGKVLNWVDAIPSTTLTVCEIEIFSETSDYSVAFATPDDLRGIVDGTTPAELITYTDGRDDEMEYDVYGAHFGYNK